METIALAPIPDMPDKWALMEHVTVLVKEIIPQPFFQVGCVRTAGADQFHFRVRFPILAIGRLQKLAQPLCRRRFSAHGREAHDAVVIRQLFQTIRAERRAIGKT